VVTTHPEVSVLIPQRDRVGLTLRAVQAVLASTYRGAVEIVVFDDASEGGPGTVADLPGVRIIESRAGIGFGQANNRLAAAASGELLLLLNNDTYLAPSALELLVDRLLDEEHQSAVCPQFRSFDGKVLELGGFVGPTGEAWQLFRGQKPPASLLHRPLVCHYGSAACLLVRRHDFLELGGFDELYAPAYYEDTDWCMRLRQRGGRVVVEPAAVVYHVEGATAGRDPTAASKRFQIRNRGRFAQRWASALRELLPLTLGTALRHCLGAYGKNLVLVVLPEFLRPDQSGGHARVWREIETLVAAGFVVAVWSEHLTDCEAFAPLLEAKGIAWFGYQPSSRWPLEEPSPDLASLQDLLGLGIWDAVITWSFDATERLGRLVREHAPTTPLVADSSVLMHRQLERGLRVAARLPAALEISRERELAAYAMADAVIASSEADAESIRDDLAASAEVFAFGVGAYPVVSVNGTQAGGSLAFLGNFLHPPNLDAIEWWLDEVAPELARVAGRPLALRVIGSWADSVLERFAARRGLDVVGWVPTLDEELSHCRVFVAPLRYGAGTKDKISLAMRFGIPTVTTSIGAESMPEELLGALEVHDEASLFAARVANLMTDDAAWRRAAARTRVAAERAWLGQQHSQGRFPRWLRGIIERGRVR
jgi:GT2 family glycosyltransferase